MPDSRRNGIAPYLQISNVLGAPVTLLNMTMLGRLEE